eukprot:c3631_g1_i1.p1 GENE.c3631_g1_i1~~c3631_g1_i1.p1  ORF type:complete len:181 (+),score=44.99 c3631_g1_i1:36-578(+)
MKLVCAVLVLSFCVGASADSTPAECTVCQQYVTAFQAKRFVHPFFQWKNLNRPPISRSDFCGGFDVLRKSQCDQFIDDLESNSDKIASLVKVLRNGCVQSIPDDCNRKWIGVCPAHVACNCLGYCTASQFDDEDTTSQCIEPCEDFVCSNCERVAAEPQKLTCRMCEVGGVLYGKASRIV